jgi:hypothetical protein
VAGKFIEQIKRAREAAEGPAAEQEQAKPTEQMTDDELEEAITAKRRQLLDLQHQELRERELARVKDEGLRPMTEEAHSPNQPLSSYEDLRGSARGQAGELWKAADKEEASLGAYYEQLKEDPRFTEEHKAELAWGRYNQAKEKIVEGREKAGEQLANDAAVYHRQSIPFPASEGPVTQDSQKILITQNETARISRKLSRMQEQTTGPFRPDLTSALREEYERGLEVGGVMGGSLCRGVLAVCDEYGVEANAVVDSFRQDRHRELIERAQYAEHLQDYLGKRVSEPPYPKPASERARITGIGKPAVSDIEPRDPEVRRGRKLFPNKPQSHMRKSSQGFGEYSPNAADEVSKQGNRRSKGKR